MLQFIYSGQFYAKAFNKLIAKRQEINKKKVTRGSDSSSPIARFKIHPHQG
jgi:hypothetical protein